VTTLTEAELRGMDGPARAPTWLIVLSYVALLAVLILPDGFEYPAVLAGLFAYPFMQWACPLCRVDLSRPLTPLNWALLLFLLQVVAFPLVVTFAGPAQGTLPYLPTSFAINSAMLLIALSYIAFCLGYQFTARRLKASQPAGAGRADGTTTTTTRVDPASWPAYVLANFAAGAVGLYCTFGGVEGLVRYFTDPAEHKLALAEAQVSVVGVAGTFLKPFLGFAFIMVWCVWADRHGREGSSLRRLVISGLLTLPALLSFATFNYNRGSFIAPLVSMTAVYLARVQRVSLVALAGFGSAALGFVILIGLYRAGGLGLGELAGDAGARQELTQKLKLADEVQVYGQAPQFLGFILEQTDYGRHLYLGITLVSSMMYPVPMLGETFRPTSGPSLYNEMIYGKNGGSDQIIPFQGELFLNFHIPGIAAGYWLLGLVTAGLQHAFKRASTALEVYMTLYVSYWILFLIQANPAIVSQIFVFFLWPIYLYVATRWLLTKLLKAA
jgi:hypothetical protein